MSTEESLSDYLNESKEVSKGENPQGLCPNCWGTQEYGGKFYEAARNWDADVNTKNINVGWIRDYVNKHLHKIKLKPHKEGQVCEHCKVVYKEIK